MRLSVIGVSRARGGRPVVLYGHVWYDNVVRPVLFRLGGGDAEIAHDQTLRWLAWAGRRPGLLWLMRRMYAVRAPRDVFGLTFPNPVGLAAGLDKDAEALPAWPALGLGFVEVGTVTTQVQEGNPRPRLFRLPASQAVINHMGFKNIGAPALARRLAELGRLDVPLGISLGKSRLTPLERAVEDYTAALRLLHAYGDYFVVNVSSPNTPGLRSLQERGHLAELLGQLRVELAGLAGGAPKPLLVKIAPDLTDEAVLDAVEVCLAHDVAGLVATNTTVSRDGLAARDQARGGEPGGLSGRPLARRAREVVALVHRETGGRLPIVGVGGVVEPEDALRLFDAGASLVQVCTGLIYRGPGLVREINKALHTSHLPSGIA